MNFLGNFSHDENSEVLFFILVFLILFNTNLFGNGSFEDDCDNDNSTILFFIILFLLLFNNFNHDRGIEETVG